MFQNDEAYRENYTRLSKIAEDKGYTFNADKERENNVIGIMTMDFREFGKYFCLCKQHHPLNPKVDPLCPCDELEKEVEKDGHRFCNLFFKGGD